MKSKEKQKKSETEEEEEKGCLMYVRIHTICNVSLERHILIGSHIRKRNVIVERAKIYAYFSLTNRIINVCENFLSARRGLGWPIY